MAQPDWQPSSKLGPLPPDKRKIVEVKVKHIAIDRNAQREINWERVAQIAQEFDWNRFEMPTCSRGETNTLRCIEGQHRILALVRRDPEAIIRVLEIPEKMELAEEAAVALAITSQRKLHDALSKWELRFRRGDQHEVLAEEVLRSHGLRLGHRATPTSLACVGQVKSLIHAKRQTPEQGAESLDMVINIISEAYPMDKPDSAVTRWNADLVRAVGSLVVRHPNLKEDRLTEVLRDRVARQWISQGAAAEVPAWRKIAEILSQRYNRGLRNPKGRIGPGEDS